MYIYRFVSFYAHSMRKIRLQRSSQIWYYIVYLFIFIEIANLNLIKNEKNMFHSLN